MGWDWPKKMKLAQTNIEWAAQVSLLRPGCFGQDPLRGETQVSKARPGPPTLSLEVTTLFRQSGSQSCRRTSPWRQFFQIGLDYLRFAEFVRV
jgi:hypothetical protein